MKKTTFYILLAATCIYILASCSKHHVYPGNYNKYTYHGYHLRKQVDSLYKSDTTGKCVVAMIKGKLVLICK